MANRVIRDWTTSEKIDSLTELSELFFVRLIMKADDHGCFHANPKLLKAALFPLKDYSEKQMTLCLGELSTAGIITLYEADGRQYLKIIDFGQRLRNMLSKFPQPADNPLTIDGNQPPETKRNEVEKKSSLYDCFKSGEEAFEEMKTDELFMERLLRSVHSHGYRACNYLQLTNAIKLFITKESTKEDFYIKEKKEVKTHLVNWVTLNAKKTEIYAG